MATSAFKTLLGGALKGDDGNRRPMALYVKESFPHFLASDGHCWTALYFTSGAVSAFRAKNPAVNVTDLKGHTIKVTDYDAVLSKSTSFTSYAGLEAKIIVKGFALGGGSGAL